MQRQAYSFLLYVRFCPYGWHFWRSVQKTLCLFCPGQLLRTFGMSLNKIYLFGQIIESSPVLLRHFEKVIVLIGQFCIFILQFIVISVKTSKIVLFEVDPFDSLYRSCVDYFFLFVKKHSQLVILDQLFLLTDRSSEVLNYLPFFCF